MKKQDKATNMTFNQDLFELGSDNKTLNQIDYPVILGVGMLYRELELTEYAKMASVLIGSELDDQELRNLIEKSSKYSHIKVNIDKNNWVVFSEPNIDLNPSIWQISAINDELSQILGTLQGHTTMSLSDLGRTLGIAREQIIRNLALLVTHGYLKASINELDQLQIFRLSTGPGNEILNRLERILLGYLASSSKPNLRELAKLIGDDLDDLVKTLNQLKSDGSLQIELTRSKEIIIDKLPQLTYTRQLYNLSQVESGVLGYVLQHQSIPIARLVEYWNISPTEGYKHILDLIGSNFISFDFSMKSLSSIEDNRDQDFLIFGVVQDDENRILDKISDDTETNIDNLVGIAGDTQKDVEQNLFQLIGYGFYPNGKIIDDKFITGGSRYVLDQKACETCGTKLDILSYRCLNCGSYEGLCSVCKSPLKGINRLSSCPFCKKISHYEHISAWLTIKSICPNCRSRVNKHELVVVD